VRVRKKEDKGRLKKECVREEERGGDLRNIKRERVKE